MARTTRRKEERLELRLEADRRRLLDQAAKASGVSTSAFVLEHATLAAQQTLADRTSFVLSPEQWDAFVELLDRPVQPVEGLARFLAGPSVQDLE
ncbi:MAG: DUF1778 domain-containing protein [Chloroflexi bacterium]|nr:DUF1778 domain-containing protein [Chloroflexota bacterium]